MALKKKKLSFNRVEIDSSKVENDVGVSKNTLYLFCCFGELLEVGLHCIGCNRFLLECLQVFYHHPLNSSLPSSLNGVGLGGPYASTRYGGPNLTVYSRLGGARGLGDVAGALGDLNLVV